MTKIPKIIHQLWIGPQPAPLSIMQTWKEKHPDFKYILWNESNLKNLFLSLILHLFSFRATRILNSDFIDSFSLVASLFCFYLHIFQV